jgi:S1-C subfamily serine protease
VPRAADRAVALDELGVTAAARSTALVFRAHSGIDENDMTVPMTARAYLPTEAVGAASVLTSDGWLISNDVVFTSAVRAALSQYRVVLDLVSYRIEKVVVDPYTGVAFLKVQAWNLPVTSYAKGTDFQTGDAVFGFDVSEGPRKLDVIGYGPRPESSPADLVRSSERIQRVLRLSRSAGAVPPGALLVDASGEAIAVFAGDDASGSTAIPFAAFTEQIGAVLRDGKAHRPYLGVRYVDDTRMRGIADFGSRSGFGGIARLTASPDGSPAVQRRSPADDAGFRATDRITAVNGEQLGVQTSLADLVAQYAPGDIVTIDAWREGPPDGIELHLQATLSEVP